VKSLVFRATQLDDLTYIENLAITPNSYLLLCDLTVNEDKQILDICEHFTRELEAEDSTKTVRDEVDPKDIPEETWKKEKWGRIKLFYLECCDRIIQEIVVEGQEPNLEDFSLIVKWEGYAGTTMEKATKFCAISQLATIISTCHQIMKKKSLKSTSKHGVFMFMEKILDQSFIPKLQIMTRYRSRPLMLKEERSTIPASSKEKQSRGVELLYLDLSITKTCSIAEKKSTSSLIQTTYSAMVK